LLLQNVQERFLAYFDSRNSSNAGSSEIISVKDRKSIVVYHQLLHNYLGAAGTQSPLCFDTQITKIYKNQQDTY